MNISENTQVFTQSEVDKIIEKRVKRERKNLENYRELKEFISQMKDSGNLSSENIKEQIAELKSFIAESALSQKNDIPVENFDGNIRDISESHNDNDGKDALSDAEENEKNDTDFSANTEKNASFGGDENIGENAGSGENTDKNLSSADFQKTVSHPLFYTFAKGKSDDMQTLCNDFNKMLKFFRADKNAAKSAANSLKATPVFNTAAADNFSLTAGQKELAKMAGMSYKKYYELISEIPVKK